MTAFAVQVQTTNPHTQTFVSNDPADWKTNEMSEAKTWKTRNGAARWFEGRHIDGQVVVVRIGRKSGRPVGVVGA